MTVNDDETAMMGRTQKAITITLWATLVLTMVGIIGAGLWTAPGAAAPSVSSSDLPVYYSVPAFELIDQNRRPVTDQSLRGTPWIAAFIFTNCAGPCPMMSLEMSELQEAIPAKNVKLVSFSVDPERDTPEVLKQYAAKFDADEARWHFLTGDKQAIYDTAAGMMLALQEANGDTPILHSTKFLLIDGAGQVRGIYSSADEAQLKQLAEDAAELAK